MEMDVKEGGRRSRGMSTLEKCLIFLFVAMTGVCIGLIAIYFTDKANSSTHAEGECVFLENVFEVQYFKTCCNIDISYVYLLIFGYIVILR